MKRRLAFFPIMIFPYLVAFSHVELYFGDMYLQSTVHEMFRFILYPVQFIFFPLALIWTVVVFILILVKKWDAQELLRINRRMKFIQIPAYIVIFLMALLSLVTIFSFPIAFILLMLDCMSITLSGLTGLASVIRSKAEKKLSIPATIMYSIFQFIFFADLIIAIILYREIKIANENNGEKIVHQEGAS